VSFLYRTGVPSSSVSRVRARVEAVLELIPEDEIFLLSKSKINSSK